MGGLTEGELVRWLHLHTGTIVRDMVIGTGAHRPAGTEQTQPFTFLPITWVCHWG